ncbi:MAG TPA: undecaprenyl-diphosphate phosphatase [Hyphomonadaceae bacterium]|jgi:undecaprenyl-diphosphatase|nr:undecaprenyl-diphosphate phosphatase [Hyphomonadaceae bacterium]
MDGQTILQAIILGLVEGLTEFIPVSSTGHLLLTEIAMGIAEDPLWKTFTVVIQLGAILAVVALYFSRLWNVLITLPTQAGSRRFALSVIIACIPAFAVGFLLHDFIKTYLFDAPALICWSLVIGGVILLVIDRLAPKPVDLDAMNLPLWKSIVIGLFQCLSVIPGVSRSGSTIVGSMLLKIDKRAAAEFSFFLAIPIMVGAFVLDIWESKDSLTSNNLGIIAIGFVASFVFGLIVIRVMLDFIQKRGFAPFGWWRILVGGAGLVGIYFFNFGAHVVPI